MTRDAIEELGIWTFRCVFAIGAIVLAILEVEAGAALCALAIIVSFALHEIP